MNEPEVILVGVDGTEAGYAAVRFAAAEVAAASGAGRGDGVLRMAHVLLPDYEPDPAGDSVLMSSWRREIRRRGRMILDEAQRQAEELLPADRITTVLLAGHRVNALLRACVGASMVVLGDERRPIVKRIATGSVLAGVAAHAPVPVVAVPADWQPSQARGRVVVAVKDFDDAVGLVHRALELAHEHDAELTLLNAWELPPAYGGMYLGEIDFSVWDSSAREALEALLKAVPEAAFGDVGIDVRRGQPARVLVDASEEASLLVISRRSRGFPFGRLGGTGRAVLRESRCPVMVVPPTAESVSATEADASGDDVETPGEARITQ